MESREDICTGVRRVGSGVLLDDWRTMSPPREDWEKGSGPECHFMSSFFVGGRAKEEPETKISSLDDGDIALLKSYVHWRFGMNE